MMFRATRLVSTLVFTLAIVVASVWSAAHMVPQRAHDPALAAFFAAGGAAEDFCGIDAAHDDHECPFCRLLDRMPAPAPAARADAVLRAAHPALRPTGAAGRTPHPWRARAPPMI